MAHSNSILEWLLGEERTRVWVKSRRSPRPEPTPPSPLSTLGYRLMVGQRPLKPLIGVRLPVSQLVKKKLPSGSFFLYKLEISTVRGTVRQGVGRRSDMRSPFLGRRNSEPGSTALSILRAKRAQYLVTGDRLPVSQQT